MSTTALVQEPGEDIFQLKQTVGDEGKTPLTWQASQAQVIPQQKATVGATVSLLKAQIPWIRGCWRQRVERGNRSYGVLSVKVGEKDLTTDSWLAFPSLQGCKNCGE